MRCDGTIGNKGMEGLKERRKRKIGRIMRRVSPCKAKRQRVAKLRPAEDV